MMYCTFAVVFIAQAYNIDLSLGQHAAMLLLPMVTSKGMAGVPRASLAVIAATLSTFNVPEAGLLLTIGRPCAVLEAIELTLRRFDEVDAAFAFDEGEGDRTLVY